MKNYSRDNVPIPLVLITRGNGTKNETKSMMIQNDYDREFKIIQEKLTRCIAETRGLIAAAMTRHSSLALK